MRKNTKRTQNCIPNTGKQQIRNLTSANTGVKKANANHAISNEEDVV